MEVNSEYIAHISNSGEIQSVAEHSLCTAQMAEGFSIDELKKIIHTCGLLHDIGKYAYEFQKHIKQIDSNHFKVSIPDIKRASTNMADVFLGEDLVSHIQIKAVGKSASMNDDFDDLF